MLARNLIMKLDRLSMQIQEQGDSEIQRVQQFSA